MTPTEVGIIGIVILFILLFSGISIGMAMGLVGFFGFAYLNGFDPALGMMKTSTYRTFQSYGLTVVPLFIFMGEICYHAGISQSVYRTVYKWMGFVRGGLAISTIGACAVFAAVSGSSAATAATMGTVALPEMKKYKYDYALATGCLAAGGGIGILIPPSVILIVYGLLVEQSIGELFMAGFIPGILQAILFITVVYLLCLNNFRLGPPGPRTTFREKVFSLKDSWIVLVLFALVMGGIYIGVFTPTEAAGVGGFGALAYAVVTRAISWRILMNSLIDTGKTTAMIFLIVLGAQYLGYFLAVTRLPNELATFVTALEVNHYVIIAAIFFMYLILGTFMEGLSMMLVTIPIVYPMIIALGFDPIWFGIMIVIVFEMGLITPPVGINVFIIGGLDTSIPMYTIFKGIIPFLIADIFLVALLIAFPQIVMFLPNLM